MRKVIFFWFVLFMICAFLAIHFSLPKKARAAEALYYHKQGIFYLCDENAELAEVADEQFGINRILVGEDTTILPPRLLF